MWQHVNRALGPVVALQVVFVLGERAHSKYFSTRLLRSMPEKVIYPHPRFLLSVAEGIMSLSAIYESVASFRSDANLEAIATTPASHSHEEAMLLEEPVSSCMDEETEKHTTTTTTTITEGWVAGLEPITVLGVTLPSSTTMIVQGQPCHLFRNGYGVRTVRAPFGYNLHVYVATLYSQQPIRSEADVETLLNSGFVMEFTFLRDVTPSQMSIAWKYQLDTSVTEGNYEGYPADRDAFLELLDGPTGIFKGGVIRFDFRPDCMVVTKQGQVVGEIDGSDFPKAFSSMWFGSQPVMEEIKSGLLQGGSSEGDVE